MPRDRDTMENEILGNQLPNNKCELRVHNYRTEVMPMSQIYLN